MMRYPIDPFTPAVELAAAIRRKEASPVGVVDSYLARMYELDPDRVEPHNRVLRAAARAVDSWTYAGSARKAQLMSRRIVEAFVASFDLLVMPTMASCQRPSVHGEQATTIP
jgi:Asp-tRNA(Asn)/Glu-tRNA(Gln) amidotransferase A subunit family amidase